MVSRLRMNLASLLFLEHLSAANIYTVRWSWMEHVLVNILCRINFQLLVQINWFLILRVGSYIISITVLTWKFLYSCFVISYTLYTVFILKIIEYNVKLIYSLKDAFKLAASFDSLSTCLHRIVHRCFLRDGIRQLKLRLVARQPNRYRPVLPQRSCFPG